MKWFLALAALAALMPAPVQAQLHVGLSVQRDRYPLVYPSYVYTTPGYVYGPAVTYTAAYGLYTPTTMHYAPAFVQMADTATQLRALDAKIGAMERSVAQQTGVILNHEDAIRELRAKQFAPK